MIALQLDQTCGAKMEKSANNLLDLSLPYIDDYSAQTLENAFSILLSSNGYLYIPKHLRLQQQCVALFSFAAYGVLLFFLLAVLLGPI